MDSNFQIASGASFAAQTLGSVSTSTTGVMGSKIVVMAATKWAARKVREKLEQYTTRTVSALLKSAVNENIITGALVFPLNSYP